MKRMSTPPLPICQPLGFLSALCLLLSGCSRGPATAADLQAALPRQFRGEITFQGDPQKHTLVVEPHEFKVRGTHLLEFDRVRYQILAGGSNVVAEGDAGIQGTISTPGLEIRIEEMTDTAEAGGGEAIKADTFKGNLSADLHNRRRHVDDGSGAGDEAQGYGDRTLKRFSFTLPNGITTILALSS